LPYLMGLAYARHMLIRAEFAMLLILWLSGFASLLSYVL